MIRSRSISAEQDGGSGRPVASRSDTHLPVGGVPIFDGALADAVGLCVDWMDAGHGGRVATANLDFLAIARRDVHLRQLLADSHLVVADGAPVAWLARLEGGAQTGRVGGVDLVAGLLESSTARGSLRVALYGGAPEVSQRARAEIERLYPAVRVVAAISPPYGDRPPHEVALDREHLRSAAPELVLVALGCPKQERVIGEFYEAVPGAVWIGVGGTLDIIAGDRRRAPRYLQRLGLEWASRLAQEPTRLWRRYLLRDLPVFVTLLPSGLAAAARRRFRGFTQRAL